MQHSNRIVVFYLVTLFLVAAILAGSGSQEVAQTSPRFTTLPTASVGLADVLGTWTGTWTDTVFNVGGSLDFEITEDAGTYNATGDIGLQVLGLGIESGTATGVVAGNTLSFSFESGTVGNGGGSLIDTGDATGLGSVTAPLNFGTFSFVGTLTSTQMTGSFEFITPGSGKGIGSLTKQSTAVTAEPWGEVKDRYRD